MRSSTAERQPDVGYARLGEILTNEILRAILAGEYEPGSALSQVALAERFGVSRAPIRDALKTLEAEGLIGIHPTRGAYIPRLTPEEVTEAYRIREALDALAAEAAASKMTDECLAELRLLHAEMGRSADLDDLGRWQELDRSFHVAAFEQAGMPRLLNLIRSLFYSTQAYRRTYLRTRDHIARAAETHARLIEAFTARDPMAARQLTIQHIRDTVAGGINSGTPGD